MRDLLFLLAEIILSFVFAWLLASYRPQWTRTRVAWLGTLPLALLLWVFFAGIIISALWAQYFSPESCENGGCGMAISLSGIFILGTLFLYLAGAIFSFLGFQMAWRSQRARAGSEEG